MKHIVKADEPANLTRWKAKNVPGKGYGDLQDPVKGELRTALITEQGWICCYCECRISQDDSHIEHFCPQRGGDSCPDQDLDYANLHASCQRNLRPREPLHCGMRKGNWFDRDLLISPLDPECGARFRFAEDGAIYPARPGDQSAQATIDRLGLDIDELRRLREAVIRELEDLPKAKVKQMLDASPQGKHQEFFSAIQQTCGS